MKIDFLGHAAFCVETEAALILMNPWLSDEGASDAAWFQFPCNHHLAGPVIERVRASRKEKLVYLSHDRPEHADLPYLARLPMDEIRLVYPNVSRSRLPRLLAPLAFKEKIAVGDRQKLAFAGGTLEFFLEDTGLDRGASVFVRSGTSTFLHVDDFELADRLADFRRENGPIDVLAGGRISETKTTDALETIARSIEIVEPSFYLASAGPPCFLDPALQHLEEEDVTGFPRVAAIRAFLDARLPGSKCRWPEITPGDVLDVVRGRFETKLPPPYGPTREARLAYLRAYAERARPHVAKFQRIAAETDPRVVFPALHEHLRKKLDVLPFRERVHGPLYFGLDELPGVFVRVDFAAGTTEVVAGLAHPSAREEAYDLITAPAWQVMRAVDETISWECFASTFRARRERRPDRHQAILNAFLRLQIDDLPGFGEKLRRIEKRKERLTVVAGGCAYEVDRTCPHQGSDLETGRIEEDRYLVCSKHEWRFDLTNGGRCTTNATTVKATRKV